MSDQHPPETGDTPKPAAKPASKKAPKQVKTKPVKTGSDKAKLDKPKSDKPSFQIPKLSETQWAMVAGAVFFVGYALYNFVLMAPSGSGSESMGLTAPVQAITEETEEQRFKRENRNKLPDGSAISRHELEQTTQVTQQVPFGDKEWEFRVRLPNNWVMSEFARYGLPGEEKYAVLTNIARYFGPAIEDARPFLWVEVERQKRYMTAEAWARAYMIKRGIAPQAIQVNSTADVQVLYVDVRDFRTYAVRTLFRVVGDTMVLVSFGVPIQVYNEFKDMMAVSLGSFHILRPNDRQIEEIKDYRLLNVLKFQYYASWLPRNEYSDSTLRPSIELHNPQPINNKSNELLQGLIMVNVWRKSDQFTHEANMRVIQDRLQELSMILRDPISETKDLPLFNGFISIKQTPYVAQVNTYIRRDQFDIVKSEASKTQQEVWVTILDNDYYVAYLTMITPLQATNYVIWAQNMAAYDLLMKSIDIRKSPSND